MSEIRTNLLKSERGDASPSAPFGLRVSGVTTTGTLTVSGNATIGGNLGVAGTITYEDVARVDATGISTFREGFNLGPLAGIALTAYNDGSIRSTGIITASSFVGDGSGLTGAGPTLANGSNDRVVTSTGANALNAEANMQFDGTDLFIPSAIKHLGDSDNHISFSGTDLQLFTTAGSGRMRITDGGVIEMGTAIGASGFDANARLRVGRSNDCNIAIRATGDTTSHTGIYFGDSAAANSGYIQYMNSGDYMRFYTNGNNERLRITSGGRLLYGNHINDRGSELQYEGSQHAMLGLHRNTADHGAPAMTFSASRGTSAGSNTIVQNNDYLGMINFKGADGSDLAAGAYITGIVDGTPGSNDMPTRLGFWTAPGGQTPYERLRITTVGDISFPAGNSNGGSSSGLCWHNNGNGDSFRIFTTPKTKGGTILGRYQYTQINQSQGYWHDIRSPGGGNYLASFADTGYYTEIYVTTMQTGTGDAYCKYRHFQNHDDNSATLNHMYGNSSANSNRPYMRLNGQVPQWSMDHGGAYVMSITVDFVGGGRNNGTYTTRYGSYGAN